MDKVTIGKIVWIIGVLLMIFGAIVGFNGIMHMVTGHGFLPYSTP